MGRQREKGRGGTADCQNDNIMIFKHGHKSFSVSTLEKDRWRRVRPQQKLNPKRIKFD